MWQVKKEDRKKHADTEGKRVGRKEGRNEGRKERRKAGRKNLLVFPEQDACRDPKHT